ncbi:MAG: HupE/UreJ family protein [Deltaproteobacteria bacterium]|nr:HupE/UreJ family protein [Deltaproteobacteria bacterium]
MTRRALPLLSLLLLAPAAWAHDADLVAVQVQRGPGAQRVEAQVRVTAETLGLLAPVDADGDGLLSDADLAARAEALRAGVWGAMPLSSGGRPCALEGASSRIGEALVELRAIFLCEAGGELAQDFRLLSVLPSGYRAVVDAAVDGAAIQRLAQGTDQHVVLGGQPGAGGQPARAESLGNWVLLGMEHILAGWDHLAFLGALLLAAASVRSVLAVVTAFTLAHSVTLGLSALGVVALGGRGEQAVEVAIALSIAWVAAENLLVAAPRRRALEAFAFGLAHGLGFASVLREHGLGDSAVRALLGFNAGVELGQAAGVLAAFPALAWLRRRPAAWRWTYRTGSAGLLLAGLGWAAARVAG